jgi:hypothetical protein
MRSLLKYNLKDQSAKCHLSSASNCRADQFCVNIVANEQQKPVYAVEFTAPHTVTIPEWVASLH